jgi:hypothetical protein
MESGYHELEQMRVISNPQNILPGRKGLVVIDRLMELFSIRLWNNLKKEERVSSIQCEIHNTQKGDRSSL